MRTGRRSKRPGPRAIAALSALALGGALAVASVPAHAAAAAARVDNPYVGATPYVNEDWSALAAAEPGGSAIADEPSFVWMDRIAAIEGTTGHRGLRDHLDTALAQGANLFQVVIYDLPGRDCAALASAGELGPTEIDRYENEYIDPIADILSDAKYANMRIVALIEPDSLPNIVTNAGGTAGSTDACATMKANGNYEKGVGYALHTLGAIPNVYNYVDAAHHGWLGWDTNMGPAATEFKKAATSSGATVNDVHGFIVNTANYSALKEPYFSVGQTVNGQMVRQSKWVDWNQYVDELSYAQALRQQLVSAGFNSGIGMLIDTARNGWGGPDRPTKSSSSTDINTYVNESRVDRRIHAGNWCNQSGAGVGERPTTAPEPGIDAYVWAKPPGESDGSSSAIDNDEGKGFDRMCDPTYEGNGRNGNSPTGALPNAPVAGHWFSAQFRELLANAYPPIGSDGDNGGGDDGGDDGDNGGGDDGGDDGDNGGGDDGGDDGGTTGTLQVQYKNNDSSATDGQIRPGLQVVNTGSTPVDLKTVTLRYWFTAESGAGTFTTYCDYAALNSSNITHKVTALPTARTGADHYLEVGFTSGTLAPGASTGDIQLRLNKTDWSSFNEADDYSHGSNTSYAGASTVTAYTAGGLAFGNEP